MATNSKLPPVTYPNALSDLLSREIYQSFYRVAGTVSLNYKVEDVFGAATYLASIKPPKGMGGTVKWLAAEVPFFRAFQQQPANHQFGGFYGAFAWDGVATSPQFSDSPIINLWLFGGPRNTVILRKNAWQLYQGGALNVARVGKVAAPGRPKRTPRRAVGRPPSTPIIVAGPPTSPLQGGGGLASQFFFALRRRRPPAPQVIATKRA